jgi:ABC-type multidrug transport system fused ATPase/permease subunit
MEKVRLSILISCLVIISILGLIIYFSKLKLENIIFPDFIKHIRSSLVRFYLNKNKINFQDANVTKDINKLYELTDHVHRILVWIITILLPICIITSILNIYMFYISPVLGTINLICNIFIFYYAKREFSKLYDAFNNTVHHRDDMFNKLDNNYTNLFNIYLNNQIENTIDKNNQIEEEYSTLTKTYNKTVIRFTTYFRVILYLFFIFSVVYIYKIKTSDSFFYSTAMIIGLYNARVDSVIDEIPITLSKIFTLKNDAHLYEFNSLVTTPCPCVKGHIKIKNVSFSYKSLNNVLTNFSLEIKPGERIAIMGKTGTGKSTLVKLLLRFYRPHEGALFLDGKDIQELDPDDIRKNLYYINQKTMLFNDTILENIRYGTKSSDAEIYEFLKTYNLLTVFHPESESDTKCLSLIVNTNGSNISMGMQKVIFLVRGMLTKAPVFLIDEPFTSIDKETRHSVLHMINIETKGKTVLVITHDINGLDTILDRIIPLHN